jgi:hypothetical protein
MRFARVRSPQQDDVGVFNFRVRTGAATRSEYRRQTDDAGGVSSSVAAVDVVTAHHYPSEFLGQKIHLVGRLRATEKPKAPWTVLLHGAAKAESRTLERFVPGSGTQLAVFPDHRRGES